MDLEAIKRAVEKAAQTVPLTKEQAAEICFHHMRTKDVYTFADRVYTYAEKLDISTNELMKAVISYIENTKTKD